MTSYQSYQSYQTSAIASSDEDEQGTVADSVGIIITSSTPLYDMDFRSLRDTIIHHPLLDPSLWPFPIIYDHCHIALSPREIDADGLHSLSVIAQDLADRGAVVVVTDTGFSLMQRDLKAQVRIPVLCSAMIQVASLRLLSDSGVGVVTLDKQLIGSSNLMAMEAPPDTPVIGLDPKSLWRRDTDTPADASVLLYDLMEACEDLIRRHGVDTIVLEEPRFVAFTSRIQTRLRDVRVFDIVTAVTWIYGGHRQSGRAPGRRDTASDEEIESPGSEPRFPRRPTEGERIEDASIIGSFDALVV